MTKKAVLMQKKDDATNHIRDLGVLPEEAFEKYADVSRAEILIQKLHKVNEKMKQFGHVNKKAFEQYSNFTKQKDQLETRKQELDKSSQSIQELIETLDCRKDEAIERTFNQAAKHFTQIWKQLVPEGHGQLIMLRRIDNVCLFNDRIFRLLKMLIFLWKIIQE